MTSPGATQVARGRPRSAHVDAAVRAAVRELLAETGYPGLAVERVAARAGVGKAAIYRRWGSKAEMVFACLVHGQDLDAEAYPDHGSLTADLTALAAHIVALMQEPLVGSALPGLLADVHADPLLRSRFAATFIRQERRVVRVILRRAEDRGELPAGADEEVVHAQLLGATFAWVFMFGADTPGDLPARLARATAAGLRTPAPTGEKGPVR